MKLLNVCAAMFFGAGLLFAVSAVAAPFDGTWKVSRTGQGCKPKGVIKIRINNGTVSGSYRGASGKHIVSGGISSNGAFKFNARSPRDVVTFRGRIKGKKGKGSWSVRGRSCKGSLKIKK